jgi:hypothetical protein
MTDQRQAPFDETAIRRIAQDAMEGERARIAGIQDAARKLGVGEDVTSDLVRRGVSLDAARGALIDAAAQNDRAVETRPHIRMGGQCEVDICHATGRMHVSDSEELHLIPMTIQVKIKPPKNGYGESNAIAYLPPEGGGAPTAVAKPAATPAKAPATQAASAPPKMASAPWNKKS